MGERFFRLPFRQDTILVLPERGQLFVDFLAAFFVLYAQLGIGFHQLVAAHGKLPVLLIRQIDLVGPGAGFIL